MLRKQQDCNSAYMYNGELLWLSAQRYVHAMALYATVQSWRGSQTLPKHTHNKTSTTCLLQYNKHAFECLYYLGWCQVSEHHVKCWVQSSQESLLKLRTKTCLIFESLIQLWPVVQTTLLMLDCLLSVEPQAPCIVPARCTTTMLWSLHGRCMSIPSNSNMTWT